MMVKIGMDANMPIRGFVEAGELLPSIYGFAVEMKIASALELSCILLNLYVLSSIRSLLV